MSDVICDTSVLQYLHQLDLLHILPSLATNVFVPAAVVEEIEVGIEHQVDLPRLKEIEWIRVETPQAITALPLVADLGPGEAQVLMLALERPGTVALLDDGLARRVASLLDIPMTGTLGLLLDSKKAGLISAVKPLLDELQRLNFRLDADTRRIVLKLANEN